MKLNIKKALYGDPVYNEVAATYNKGASTCNVGAWYQLNADNLVPARTTKGATSTKISSGRAAKSCEIGPGFVIKRYDKGNAYGTAALRGCSVKWKCDGQVVKTNLPAYEEANIEFNDTIVLGLFPLIAWYEPQDEDTKNFRQKYQNGYDVTLVDVLRYNDAFYYSPVVPREIDIILGCADSEVEPAGSNTPKSKVTKGATMLPWNSIKTDSIPNDFSVEAAMQGKYLLPGNWGKVKEGDEEYDFSADLLPLEFLEGYVDNPSFNSVLSQFVCYFGSLFRANKLEDKETNGAINQFLSYQGIRMKTSNLQNVMLVGDPGTGKTILMRALAAALGLPVAIIRIGERDDRDVLTQEVRVTNAGFRTKHSQLYWYAKYGGITVFDDVTNADPNMLFSTIGGLLEAPYEYRVGDETVKRNILSLVSATANIGTNGAQVQNQALLTRFSSHEVVEKLSEDDFKICIWRRASAAAAYQPSAKVQGEIVDWTYKVFTKVQSTVGDIDKNISDQLITLRSAISLCERLLDAKAEGVEINAVEAACKSMGNILYSGGQAGLQKAVCAAIRGLPALKY